MLTRNSLARPWRVALIGVALLGSLAGLALLRWWHISTDLPPAPNYEDDAAWLCRPGRKDACGTATTATVFEPGGRRRVETYAPNPAAPIDCFYLYPTVSRARRAYSPIAATEQESSIARRQLARFTTVCRPFAPLYRQVTLAGLPLLFGRDSEHVSLRAPLDDVLAAWKTYLSKDNDGRGVVLIGHSQGSRLLARLIRTEIDGKPLQAKLISAIIPGADIDVPEGKDVGGSFQHVPLCRFATQTGCVIAYSSYPANRRMPADASFGASRTRGMRDACVNPAAVDGSSDLDADLPLTREFEERFHTDFAELRGLLTASCKDDGRFSILAVGVHPEDRAGEHAKALLDRLAEPHPASGFHSLDINLALGTLIELVRKETGSHLHASRPILPDSAARPTPRL